MVDKLVMVFLVVGVLYIADAITNLKWKEVKKDVNITIRYDDKTFVTKEFEYLHNGSCINFVVNKERHIVCGTFNLTTEVKDSDDNKT